MKHAFVALMLISALQSRSQVCELSLKGHVEDVDSRDKLQGATVHIRELNLSIVTNENGDFEFAGVCPGTYSLVVSHIGCETVHKTVQLQRSRHIDVFLPHEKNALEVVTIAGVRGIPNTGFRQEVSGRDLDETRGRSLAEALARINGVTMLQTGSTIAKPVLHGLHSNRILTINNGVRQEGQQWGNEHAPEIDPFIADKLVVIKGVDELKYGSDAIGGVILVEPRPLRNINGMSGEFNSGFSTNNRQFVASAIFEHQLARNPALSYRLQGTFKKAADVATPAYRLNNTALQEENFSITAGYKKEQLSLEAFFSQFHTRVGIFSGAHIGNLTDLLSAIQNQRPDPVHTDENSYSIGRPYQDVNHRLMKLRGSLKKGESRFNATFAAQFNKRQEFDISRNQARSGPQLDLSILTLTEDFSWEHPSVKSIRGTVGVTLMQQQNRYSGRYFIPNYQSNTVGGYIIEKWSAHNWDLQAGIRFDHKAIDTRRMRYNGAETNHDFRFSTLASSLNAVYKISERTRVNATISLANRAPHVNELLSDGIHHGTATYEVGNIHLSPEQAINTAIGFSYNSKSEKFTAELNLYNNAIDNFIYQQPKPNEPVLTIAGAFPKLQYEQADAVLRGADLSISLAVTSKLNWISRASILRAFNRDTDDWLILMPSDRFSNEVVYNFGESERFTDSYVSLSVSNVLRQTRFPSEKNERQDYMPPPAGYDLIGLNASTTTSIGNTPVTFGISVSNLLNTRYREYMNSFRYYTDEMGRNVQLRIRIPLSNKPN